MITCPPQLDFQGVLRQGESSGWRRKGGGVRGGGCSHVDEGRVALQPELQLGGRDCAVQVPGADARGRRAVQSITGYHSR